MKNVSKSGDIFLLRELTLRALRKRLKFRKKYVRQNYSLLKVLKKSLRQHTSIF